MDCVTQSASPLGHNLKNDTMKGFVLNNNFFDKLRAERFGLSALALLKGGAI
jgi:hypothetical protein